MVASQQKDLLAAVHILCHAPLCRHGVQNPNPNAVPRRPPTMTVLVTKKILTNIAKSLGVPNPIQTYPSESAIGTRGMMDGAQNGSVAR